MNDLLLDHRTPPHSLRNLQIPIVLPCLVMASVFQGHTSLVGIEGSTLVLRLTLLMHGRSSRVANRHNMPSGRPCDDVGREGDLLLSRHVTRDGNAMLW